MLKKIWLLIKSIIKFITNTQRNIESNDGKTTIIIDENLANDVIDKGKDIFNNCIDNEDEKPEIPSVEEPTISEEVESPREEIKYETVEEDDNLTEEEMYLFFKNKGLNDFGVAGLMGNLYAESGLRSTNLQNSYEKKLDFTDEEYTKAVNSGAYSRDDFINDKAGYGIAQWTYWSRKQNLLDYAIEQQKSIGNCRMQCNFLIKELTTSYKSVFNALVSATSVREASDVVLLKFERPANQSEEVQEKRASYGMVYYEKYAKNK